MVNREYNGNSVHGDLAYGIVEGMAADLDITAFTAEGVKNSECGMAARRCDCAQAEDR